MEESDDESDKENDFDNSSALEDDADAISKNNMTICFENKNRIVNELQHNTYSFKCHHNLF